MELQNKVALVTGGASGFGAAIAKRLGRAGARVVVADLNAQGAQRMAAELADLKVAACAVSGDVSKQEDYQRMVDSAVAQFGRIDVVVNNAGTTHRNQPALQVSEDEFDRIYRVNLKSVYWAAQIALPLFVQQGHGVMINVASTTGVRPGPGLTWYSGSKAAMINLTKGLALEFARHGIRINAVNPMIGETPMMADFMGMEDTPANREKFLARIPLGRFTRPDDVASAVTYLACDESSFLTGVCLDVDGGRNI
jgi:NAD(P)-dependent dehydrogenase (short-subunit alcohol dehydrogenase family)